MQKRSWLLSGKSVIVPIVRTIERESAILAVEAIYNGGVRAAEITMTVPGAIGALEKVADRFGDKMVLGAGTVLDPETARICMLAGAEFFVTPALRWPPSNGQALLEGDLPGRADPHRSADRLGSRRRRGEDLPLR